MKIFLLIFLFSCSSARLKVGHCFTYNSLTRSDKPVFKIVGFDREYYYYRYRHSKNLSIVQNSPISWIEEYTIPTNCIKELE